MSARVGPLEYVHVALHSKDSLDTAAILDSMYSEFLEFSRKQGFSIGSPETNVFGFIGNLIGLYNESKDEVDFAGIRVVQQQLKEARQKATK